MLQQQLRQKQHIGRKGGMGRPRNCTELHGNKGMTMKTMRGYPNNIRGNGHRRTRSDVRALKKTKQHDSTIIAPKTTHWAQKGYGVTTELHGTARKRGNNNEDNRRDNEDNARVSECYS